MKNLKLMVSLALAAGMITLTGAAFAADATANATATIQTGIAVAKDGTSLTNGDLAFGTLIPDGDGGTVVVNPTTGDRTPTGVTGVTSTYGPASFNVTGSPSTAFTITLPSTATTISDSNSHTMSVNEWTCDDTDLAMSLTAQGGATFKVGGTLTVSGNQADGTYSGTFNVTVAYN